MGLTLRYDDPDAVDHPLYERFATVTPGAPGRCPACDAFGYIDHADLTRFVQSQHCRECGLRWEYDFDAEGRIAAVRGLPVPAVSGRPAPSARAEDGVLDLRPAPPRRARPLQSSRAPAPPAR